MMEDMEEEVKIVTQTEKLFRRALAWRKVAFRWMCWSINQRRKIVNRKCSLKGRKQGGKHWDPHWRDSGLCGAPAISCVTGKCREMVCAG